MTTPDLPRKDVQADRATMHDEEGNPIPNALQWLHDDIDALRAQRDAAVELIQRVLDGEWEHPVTHNALLEDIDAFLAVPGSSASPIWNTAPYGIASAPDLVGE